MIAFVPATMILCDALSVHVPFWTEYHNVWAPIGKFEGIKVPPDTALGKPNILYVPPAGAPPFNAIGAEP